MKRMILGVMLCMSAATWTLRADASGERYTFARPSAPASAVDASRLKLSIDKWASDADRDHMRKFLNEQGVANIAKAFPVTSDVGRLAWPGGLEYGVRYARKTTRADGGVDAVLVLDRPLWVWWDDTAASGGKAASDEPAVIVQLQLDAKGRGEGRISYAGVGAKSDARLGVALADYARAPALLTELRLDDREGA